MKRHCFAIALLTAASMSWANAQKPVLAPLPKPATPNAIPVSSPAVTPASPTCSPITPPPQTISVVLSAAPMPAVPSVGQPSGPVAWSQGHEPSLWSKFIDGTAAVFGLVSAALALTIAFLAVKGLSSYRELLQRIEQEVTQRLEQDLDKRVTTPAIAKVQGEVDKAISERIRGAIETAEKSLEEELKRLAKEPEWQEQFTQEVVKRVQESLQPPSQDISTTEFDEPHANT